MPGFLTDDQLGDSVATFLGYADHLALYGANPRWASIIFDSNKSAYDGLLNAAVALGYTAAPLLAWDLGYDFQRDIGKFWAIQNSAGFSGLEPYAAKAFDRRNESVSAMENGLLTAGVLVEPIPAGGGLALAGQGRSGKVDLSRSAFGDPDRRWAWERKGYANGIPRGGFPMGY